MCLRRRPRGGHGCTPVSGQRSSSDQRAHKYHGICRHPAGWRKKVAARFGASERMLGSGRRGAVIQIASGRLDRSSVGYFVCGGGAVCVLREGVVVGMEWFCLLGWRSGRSGSWVVGWGGQGAAPPFPPGMPTDFSLVQSSTALHLHLFSGSVFAFQSIGISVRVSLEGIEHAAPRWRVSRVYSFSLDRVCPFLRRPSVSASCSSSPAEIRAFAYLRARELARQAVSVAIRLSIRSTQASSAPLSLHPRPAVLSTLSLYFARSPRPPRSSNRHWQHLGAEFSWKLLVAKVRHWCLVHKHRYSIERPQVIMLAFAPTTTFLRFVSAIIL